MDNKDPKPNEGNVQERAPTELASPAAVRFDNSDAARAWVAAVRPLVNELIEWGRDAARPKRERVLSHWEALRRIRRASRSLDNLFAAADRGLR